MAQDETRSTPDIPAVNPFADEKPQLVHFEKDESHYEACRMQMRDIERVHRRTFFVNTGICILVCLLSVFRVYIAGFDLLSTALAEVDDPGAILTGGIFQILFGMVCIVMGYFAWANWHTVNIFLAAWYLLVTAIGIKHGDYISAVIGVVGLVFYIFSIREMRREESLAQMEGYPDFQEKFDISKSDIVIQTLLAHKGERRTKSTLFTTDYSLRRKKKGANAAKAKSDAGAALAERLSQLTENAAQLTEEPEQEQATEPKPEPVKATEPVSAGDTVQEAVQETAPAETEATSEAAAEIIAEAEAKAQQILAEAIAKAGAIRSAGAPEASGQQTAQKKPTAAEAQKKPAENAPQQNRNRSRKKRGGAPKK